MSERNGDKLKEHVVAYIDILGAKQHIEDPFFLRAVNAVYFHTQKLYDKLYEGKRNIPHIKIFSDNIVIYHKILSHETYDESKKRAFSIVVSLSSFMQFYFAKLGILVRGGITIGDFIWTEHMIWGKALVRAYDLENNLAIYPRIIIDPKISNYAEYILKESTLEIFLKDIDNLFFINFFHELEKEECAKIYSQLKEKLDTIKVNNFNNYKVLQKLAWYENYLESRRNHAEAKNA